MKHWQAELALLAVTMIWGGTFLFTKQGLVDCPPSLFIILRFLIALIISLAFFGKHLKKINKTSLRNGIVLGLLFGGGFLLQTYGLKFTSVSKSAFITGMTVPFTPLAFWLVTRRKVLFWSKAGVIVASVGLWIFAKPEIGALNIGDVLTLISTFFWAFYITYMDVFTAGKTDFSETASLVMLHFIASAPLALATMFAFEMQDFYFNLTWNLAGALAFNGILASFVVTFIHTTVQRYSTPVKAALIFSLEPVFASVFAIIAINEILSGREYLGAVVMLFGVMISELGQYIFGKKRKL